MGLGGWITGKLNNSTVLIHGKSVFESSRNLLKYLLGREDEKLNKILEMKTKLSNKSSDLITLFADSFENIGAKISAVLFIIIIIGALASEWQTFLNNLSQLGPAIILLITFMLIIGYKSSNWFKMNRRQSVTVAIESGIQNGTVGVTIGNIIINPETGLSILSIPSGVYGILMYFICLPFVFWFIKRVNI